MKTNKLKNFTIENIVYSPLQLKLGLIFSIFLIVLWLGCNWFLDDDVDRLESAVSKIKELKINLQVKQQQTDNLELYKKQLQVAKHDFFELLGEMHATKSDDNLIDEITKIGTANNVQFKSIKSSNEKQMGNWSGQSIQLILTGDYQQLVRFLNQINSLKQLLIWSDLNFEKEDAGQLIDDLSNKHITLVIAIKKYDYLEKFPVFSMISKPIKHNKIILGARDIFAPKLTSDINGQFNEPLLGFPLNALHLVGTVLQNDKRLALILTPMGKVYWATVGNRIGQHNGKIAAISKNYMDVNETKNQEEEEEEEQIRLMLGR